MNVVIGVLLIWFLLAVVVSAGMYCLFRINPREDD